MNPVVTLWLALAMMWVASCSKNYFQSSHIAPAFDKSKSYKIVVAEPQITQQAALNNDELKNRTYNHLTLELQKIKNFTIVDRAAYERELRVRRFGTGQTIDAATAREAAKAAGGQLLALTEISTEAVKGGLPILASIQLIEIGSGNILYQGKARMKNPASLEAGVELAIEKAMEELVLKTK